MDDSLARYYACLYLENEIESTAERLKDNGLPTEEKAALEKILSDLKKDYATIFEMDYDQMMTIILVFILSEIGRNFYGKREGECF